MSTQRHEAEQFEMSIHREVAEGPQRYTLTTLREFRDQLQEILSKASVGAETLHVIMLDLPGAGAAFAKALERDGRRRVKRAGGSIAKHLRTFRTLCLYIAQRERQEAPHARPVSVLPPPEPSPELVPGRLTF